jgi:hypothetical protein
MTDPALIAARPISIRTIGQAIQTIAAEEGVAYWDSYAESGIGPSNYTYGTGAQAPGSTMADYVHPSPYGGATFLGPGLGKAMERVFG